MAPGSSHGWELCDDLLVYNCFMRVEAAQFDISWAQRDARLGRLFAPTSRPRAPIVVRLDENAFQRCHAHLEAIRERADGDRGEAFDLGHLLLALDIVARSVELAESVEGGPSVAAPAVIRAAVELLEQDLRRTGRWTRWQVSSASGPSTWLASSSVGLARRPSPSPIAGVPSGQPSS